MPDELTHRLEAASQGDPVAIDRLLADHYPELVDLIRKQLDHNPVAQKYNCSDVVQGVALRLLRSREEFEYLGPAQFHVLMRKTTVNLLRDLAAKHQALPAGCSDLEVIAGRPVVDSANSPSQGALGQDFKEKAMSLLEDPERRALQLHLEGLTLQEIADRLGLTFKQARGSVTRALGTVARLGGPDRTRSKKPSN